MRHSPVRERGPRLTNRDWSYMPGRRNRRRRRNLQNRINYSDEGDVIIVPEINRKKTGLRWKQARTRTFKFVDDGMMLTKVCMDNTTTTMQTGRPGRDKHDTQTQNLFRRVVAKAEARGMVVNKKKTKVVCVSDAQTYHCLLYTSDAADDS